MKLSAAFTTLLALTSLSLSLASEPPYAKVSTKRSELSNQSLKREAETATTDLEKRAVWSTCEGWEVMSPDNIPHTNPQNLWGASSGTGSQCFSLDSASSGTFAWSTTWSWSGGPYNVKSYDNISWNFSSGIRVSSITSIPATWNWSQSGTSPINNVAYDLMSSATSSTSANKDYEIMIWLAAYGGAGPISSSGQPVATPTIAGRAWRLYDGYNGSMRVFSFVATSTVTSFSSDLKLFLNYLASNNGYPTSQYLTVLQGGTEPFTGSNVKLTTTQFKLSVSGSASTTTTSSGSTPTGSVPLYGQCGGSGYTGPTTCASGTCTYSSEWYSQCLP